MKYLDVIRQGDVLLKKIEAIPAEATPTTLGRSKAGDIILQASEVTGHHHQFKAGSMVDTYTIPIEKAPGINTITDNEGKLIVVNEPSYLFHGKLFDHQPQLKGTGDHESIKIEPGVYVIDIVREYNYDFHETRRVVD